MVRQFLSEQLLFAAGEVSTCGDGAGFDGPLNHPKGMVTNSIKRQTAERMSQFISRKVLGTWDLDFCRSSEDLSAAEGLADLLSRPFALTDGASLPSFSS